MHPRAVTSWIRRAVLLVPAALLLLALPSNVLRAQAGWPTVRLVDPIGGFAQPVFIGHAGDASGRLFVVEQPGRVRIVRDGALLATPFLDITDRVLCCGERGLLGLAFAPDFDSSGVFYVYYTARAGSGDITISRFIRGAAPDQANAASEQILLTIEHSSEGNHNGGMLAFGPRDGYLYIGTGDGGSGDDPPNNAQNPASLLGKLLRIDVTTPPTSRAPPTSPTPTTGPRPSSSPIAYPQRRFLPMAQSVPGAAQGGAPATRQVLAGELPARGAAQLAYVVPASNPFVGRAGFRPEIWALGLRNPWRFSFDRQSGELYIADVGQGGWEEVDWAPAAHSGGANYGWRVVEGPACNAVYNAACDRSQYVAPVASYARNEGRSITGGYVYRGTRTPALAGIYVFADYAMGTIFGLRLQNGAWSRQSIGAATSITSFGEDQAGEVYAAEYGGTIYRLASQ